MAAMTPRDGWEQWGQHVLAELQRMDRGLDRLNTQVSEIRGTVIANQLKLTMVSGFTALVVGGIVSGVMSYFLS